MKNYEIYIAVALGTTLLIGCAPSGSVKKSAKTVEHFGQAIRVCRPASHIRPLETPTIYVNGEAKDELKNGVEVILPIKAGDHLHVATKANALLYRFKNEDLFSQRVKSTESYYLLVAGKADWSFGTRVLAGGALGAAAGPAQDSWDVSLLTEDVYKKHCTSEAEHGAVSN